MCSSDLAQPEQRGHRRAVAQQGSVAQHHRVPVCGTHDHGVFTLGFTADETTHGVVVGGARSVAGKLHLPDDQPDDDRGGHHQHGDGPLQDGCAGCIEEVDGLGCRSLDLAHATVGLGGGSSLGRRGGGGC